MLYVLSKIWCWYRCSSCRMVRAINRGVDGLKRLRQILEDGESPNQRLHNGRRTLDDTVLVWAIRKENLAAIRILCQYGADINHTRIRVSFIKSISLEYLSV